MCVCVCVCVLREMFVTDMACQSLFLKEEVGFFKSFFFIKCFFCVPHLAVFFQLLNEPVLGAGIDHGMALTPFPSSIVLDEIRSHDFPIVGQVR